MFLRRLSTALLVSLFLTLAVPLNGGAVEPPSRTDIHADLLPPGAIARLGRVRWRSPKGDILMAFVPGNKYLATAIEGGRVATKGTRALSVWDLQTGRVVRTISSDGTLQGDGFEDGFALTPDGKLILSADQPGERGRGFSGDPLSSRLHLWDFSSGKRLKQSPDFGGSPNCLAIRPDGRVAAYSTYTDVFLWDLQKNVIRRVVVGDRHSRIHSLGFAENGKHLVVLPCQGGLSLRIDVASGKMLKLVDLGDCNTVALAPHGGTIATFCYCHPNQLILCDTLSGAKRCLPVEDLTGLSFSPDGRTLLATDQRTEVVQYWDVAKGQLVRRLHVPGLARADGRAYYGTELLLSANSEWLAGYEEYYEERFADTLVRIWNARTGQPQLRLPRHISPPVRLAFSADGKEVLSYAYREKSPGWQLCRWEVATGKLLTRILPDAPKERSRGAPHDRQLAPEFKHLAGRVGRAIREAVSPDGRLKARFDDAWRLCLHEVRTGKIVHRFGDDYSSIAFAPSGWRLAVGCKADASILIWDLPLLFCSQPLSSKDSSAERLWDVLASDDVVQAYRALWRLAAMAEADTFLTRNLKPVETVAPERLRALMADLGSPDFATREKAEHTLAAAGEAVRAAVGEAVAVTKDAEVRQRLRSLQPRLQPQAPERLRELRALLILESRDTAEARRLLKRLARGLPEARLTQDAKAALDRLARWKEKECHAPTR